MDVELELLTDQVLEELRMVMEDNPNMTEDEAIDWAWELADSWAPTANYDVLMLAANNLSLIGYRPVLRNRATPVEVARAAVFDYLKKVVYSEWHGHQQVLERKFADCTQSTTP